MRWNFTGRALLSDASDIRGSGMSIFDWLALYVVGSFPAALMVAWAVRKGRGNV